MSELLFYPPLFSATSVEQQGYHGSLDFEIFTQ